MRWSTACPDWRERLISGASLIPFEPLFPDQAAEALEIFKSLTIVDAAGRPTFGETDCHWLFDLVGAIFGAYDPVERRRLINKFFLLISKKNGKSTGAAAIMLTALVLNFRESGEFYVIAPTKEVADNSFLPARDMVKAHPQLSTIFKSAAGRHIEDRRNGAFLKVIAADSETTVGKKTIGLLVDELHVFGKRANAKAMLAEIEGGLASRPEGFVIYTSTHADEEPSGVFAEKLKEFRAIRDGLVEVPSSLPILYEFPPEMIEAESFRDEANWRLTNPNLGASVHMQFLREKHAEAAREGKASLNIFFAKHLNVQIGQNLLANGWSGAEYWDQAKDATLTLETLIARSEVITIGLDGGGGDDLFGLYVLGREASPGDDFLSKPWLGWGHGWLTQKGAEQRKSQGSKYDGFAADGDLTITETILEQLPGIVAIIELCYESGKLAGVGADAAGQAINDVVDAINMALYGSCEVPEGEGVLVAVSQSFQLQSAIGGVARRLQSGRMRHADQAIMRWMAGNAKSEMRGSAIYITKAASGVSKIDLLMALFDAAFLMGKNPRAQNGPSIYNSRGPIILRLGA